MKLNKIKYKNYTFEYNPSELQIEYSRTFSNQNIPFFGMVSQDIGIKNRIIKGTGCFFGERYMEKFNDFSKLIQSNESGMLVLPNLEPIDAFLSSLTVKAKNVPNRIDYSFIFLENSSIQINNELIPIKKYHIVAEGETIWIIAKKYSVSASTLMKLNPNIKRPDELKEGQKVVISL